MPKNIINVVDYEDGHEIEEKENNINNNNIIDYNNYNYNKDINEKDDNNNIEDDNDDDYNIDNKLKLIMERYIQKHNKK